MRILVSAYACEPGHGSEPGTGWNWARALATEHDVWVLTRTNNREQIEAEIRDHGSARMRFLYVDLPPRIRRWKKGQRGIHAYAYLWQVAARRVAREAHRQHGFELVHHVTFASALTPALTWLPDIPFVWGPVGGGVRVPWRLVPQGGRGAIAYEALRSARRLASRYADPLLRLTWRRANLILVQNPDTLSWLPRKHRTKARVTPNAGVPDVVRRPRPHRKELVAISAGRLIHLKAFSLAIRAVGLADDVPIRLEIAGDGPERAKLQQLAERLHVSDRVGFLGALPHPDLLARFAQADVLLFPSLHDECGFVVAEAMSRGTVPIVLNIGGPAMLVGPAGYVVPARGMSRREAVVGIADALRDAWNSEHLAPLREAALERARSFSWGGKLANLHPLVPPARPRSEMSV
jgi:glycosyltransferase involved in cell wall biosynthesis